jgi:ligand-binding sensor domain-containing protein
MIDSTGKVTSFNDTKTVLKNQCITSIAEDSEGNIYFGLYKFGGGGEVNRNEGIAKWSIDGDWFQYTTKNSGMPFNHTTSMAYDSSENVLWISTDRAGLIRYDLNEGWENYHSENSRISTSSISDLIIANNGVIYLGTKLGIVKIEKK